MEINRIRKLKLLNSKLHSLMPEIQKIRNDMVEQDELFLSYRYHFRYYGNISYFKGQVMVEREFKKLIKKLSIQLAKYSKINIERRKYRIFTKCTQFSLF